jgi:hypothetical protein
MEKSIYNGWLITHDMRKTRDMAFAFSPGCSVDKLPTNAVCRQMKKMMSRFSWLNLAHTTQTLIKDTVQVSKLQQARGSTHAKYPRG